MTMAKKRESISTVQRTEAKETKMDSGIVTCDHKVLNKYTHSPSETYLLSPKKSLGVNLEKKIRAESPRTV